MSHQYDLEITSLGNVENDDIMIEQELPGDSPVVQIIIANSQIPWLVRQLSLLYEPEKLSHPIPGCFDSEPVCKRSEY